ncbi:MAG TPA: hypothetical protein VD962_05020 [Rubricoccaceae bacterium]|nr:hypothetical protein [Rubricoccaceae bacterium]
MLLSERERFAAIELSGAVTFEDLAAAMRALYGHPGWDPSFYVFWDALAITQLDIPPTDLPSVKALMDETAVARAGGRSAVRVKDDVEAVLAVLFAQFGPPTGRPMGTFRSLAEALAFLDRTALPEDTVVIAAS